jgi:hypothetical protein
MFCSARLRHCTARCTAVPHVSTHAATSANPPRAPGAEPDTFAAPAQGMRNISSQMVLMLTGTPVQNNMHELFALLNFMYPSVFTDGKLFDSAFDLTHQVGCCSAACMA